jgi:glycosyltransferase involved in cell wall biosynthesis
LLFWQYPYCTTNGKVANLTKVSVIIPTYNRAHIVGRSIESALCQTHRDLEILVVDDGSTDQTLDAVKPFFLHPQVRYLRHKKNKGHQAARNTGIKNACGDYVAFLDSDDMWIPQKIELQIDALNKKGADCVVLCGYVVEKDGLQTRTFERQYEGYVYPKMLARPGPALCTMLVRRDSLKQIGFLDEETVGQADWDACISLSRFFKFTTVSQPCWRYCQDESDTVTRNFQAAALGYRHVVEKNQEEMLRLIGRRGLAKHYMTIALKYDDADNFFRCRTYMLKAFRNDNRDPVIFLFAFLTLFGKRVFHLRKPLGRILVWLARDPKIREWQLDSTRS